jgi:hypothetical protein
MWCLAALLASGCAGYRLGPSNGMEAGEKSVRVAPFVNMTMQPRLGDEVTQQIRKELQKDATFRLSSRDDADIVLTGELVNYERYEMSFAPNDVLTVKDFRVLLTAQVTARDRVSGKVLLSRKVSGNTLVRVGSDLTSAERQALPLIAEDLARGIVSLLADGDW